MNNNKLVNDNRSKFSKGNLTEGLEEIIQSTPLMQALDQGSREGAEQALEEKIPQERIDSFRKAIQQTPDDGIGPDLDNLTNSILDFIEKHPSEYVLIKLLWLITSLAAPKSLFGFGKALTTVGALKGILESED